MGMYNLILKIVQFCYFQNTFPFVSMSRQTDDIGKTRPKKIVEQSIGTRVANIDCHGHKCNILYKCKLKTMAEVYEKYRIPLLNVIVLNGTILISFMYNNDYITQTINMYCTCSIIMFCIMVINIFTCLIVLIPMESIKHTLFMMMITCLHVISGSRLLTIVSDSH